ncbi:Copper amine oxidase N-terminal domain-containing protein, partial [Thermosyntropha lipolytica DSM 11003]
APKIYPPGRTFVPVRFLGNALGIDDNNITWQANTQTAILKGNKTLKLQINNKIMHSNDKPVQMDVAPLIQHPGRTMLPARYVAEGLGYIVEWDAQHQAVIAYMDNGEKPDIAKALEMVKQVEPPKPPKNGARVYSEADLTPQMIQKIKDIHNSGLGSDWNETDPRTFDKYAEAVRRDFLKYAREGYGDPPNLKAETIVISPKLDYGPSSGWRMFRVVVDGNLVFDVKAGFDGEYGIRWVCFIGYLE